MTWVTINEERTNYPTEKGWYAVEMSVGSIDRIKVYHCQAYDPDLYQNSRPRFNGEFDWNYAIKYLKIPQP